MRRPAVHTWRSRPAPPAFASLQKVAQLENLGAELAARINFVHPLGVDCEPYASKLVVGAALVGGLHLFGAVAHDDRARTRQPARLDLEPAAKLSSASRPSTAGRLAFLVMLRWCRRPVAACGVRRLWVPR